MTDTETKSKMDELEKEIDMLHTALQKKGINSRGTTDIFGREFTVPVRLACAARRGARSCRPASASP